jgi:hypothetical protein
MLLSCPHCQIQLDCSGLTGIVACPNCRLDFAIPENAFPQPASITLLSPNVSSPSPAFDFEASSKSGKTPATFSRRRRLGLSNGVANTFAFILSVPIGITVGVVIRLVLFPNAHGALPGGVAVFCCFVAYSVLRSMFGARN